MINYFNMTFRGKYTVSATVAKLKEKVFKDISNQFMFEASNCTSDKELEDVLVKYNEMMK